MLKRTPVLSIVFTAILTLLTIFIFEDPARPFTSGQAVLIFVIAFFPAVGFALFFDPNSAAKKRLYMKINFYDQDKSAEELIAEMEAQEKDKQ